MSSPDFDTLNETPMCRICYDSSETLYRSPCKCSGSVGYVHGDCFKRLLEHKKNFQNCEVCSSNYKEGTIVPKRYY